MAIVSALLNLTVQMEFSQNLIEYNEFSESDQINGAWIGVSLNISRGETKWGLRKSRTQALNRSQLDVLNC